MKRFVLAAFSCAVLLLGTVAAWGTASTDAAITALKHSAVYVAPGTENTNSDTAGELVNQLNSGDNLVIVMLPASALSEAGGDIGALVAPIDAATKHQRIIGLSAGNQLVAASSIMPVGEATDLMNRASSVATNTRETLTTFIQNVHDWQAQHPQAKASQPVSKSKSGSPSVAAFLLIAAVIVILVIGIPSLVYWLRASDDERSDSRIKFKQSPDLVRDQLREIQDLSQQVRDTDARQSLQHICEYSEAFFQRARDRDGYIDSSDAEVFSRDLTNVKAVLKRYIDIQDEPNYYDDPMGSMQDGEESFAGYAQHVLETIRREGRRGLTDYRVNTRILAAQRYE